MKIPRMIWDEVFFTLRVSFDVLIIINKVLAPKPPYPTTVVRDNRRTPPLDGEQSTKIGGMWDLKYEIRSQIFYELLIKT